MPVRTRRWNDPAQIDDGVRILICRYRPRGLARSAETWDRWLANLGPSKSLHAAVYGKTGSGPISWSIYRAAYLNEMKQQKAAIEQLARQVAGGQTITLLCSSHCVRADRCHRSLLAKLIESAAAQWRGGNHSL